MEDWPSLYIFFFKVMSCLVWRSDLAQLSAVRALARSRNMGGEHPTDLRVYLDFTLTAGQCVAHQLSPAPLDRV